MTKSEVRNYIKKRRNELPINLRNEYSSTIHDKLFAREDFKESDLLFTYISFGSEVDTVAIIQKAFQMNKKVYVPKVEEDKMNFYEILSFDGLIRSDFGILEPDSSRDKMFQSSMMHNEKKLMLLPGLAFDKTGNRIGYGAGYYDRYLGRHPINEWIKIALAYEFQILEAVEHDKYDIPADYIITSEK